MNVEEMMKSVMDGIKDVACGHTPDGYRERFTPERVYKSDKVTVFIWADGTKTIVKRGDGEIDSNEAAYLNALAKKMFGSRTQVKKLIAGMDFEQVVKKGKKDEAVPTSDTSAESDGTV